MPKNTTSPIKNTVHFIGIGGIGISALARWFLVQKWLVSGSDMYSSSLTRKLKKEGIKLKIGHKKAHITPKIGLVIYNQAIPPSNPELKEAKRLGIPTFTYPEALGSLTREFSTFAVSGSHGKSTTTALLSLTLIKAGFDPTVILGTLLKQFGGKNFRAGKSEYLVIEADEWKASFLNYSPLFAIITNIDKEHLDFYKNYSNIKKTFLKFVSNIKEGGILVANKESERLFALKKQIEKICKKRDIKLIWYSSKQKAAKEVKKALKVPGDHNLSNAMGVYALSSVLGIKDKVIIQALGQYQGAWRRMEHKGSLRSKKSVPIYDDYAHHPTEIQAALQAFREKFPKRKIICVFQPHQAHRTQNLFKEFVSAFNLADQLILLPIYQVAGRDKPHKGYSSHDLSKAIEKENKNLDVLYLKDPKDLRKKLKEIIENGSSSAVVVMMGAGDIANYTDSLLKNNG